MEKLCSLSVVKNGWWEMYPTHPPLGVIFTKPIITSQI